MLNICQFIGNTTRKPEIGTTQNGAKYARFTVACNERGYRKADGTEVPERTEFVNCIAWRGSAELLEKYVNKGDRLYVQGKFRTEKWTDENGVDRWNSSIYCDSIELLGGRRESAPAPTEPENVQSAGEVPAAPLSGDGLPF